MLDTPDKSTAMTNNPFPERIVINVGGMRYETTRHTILTYPESLLARMLSPENLCLLRFEGVQNNEIFFDRNGKLFEYVLDYYRNGSEVILPSGVSPKAVERELMYFGLDVPSITYSHTGNFNNSDTPPHDPNEEKKTPTIIIDDPRPPLLDDGLPSSSFEVMRHSEFLGFNSMGYSLNSRHYFIAVSFLPLSPFHLPVASPSLPTNATHSPPNLIRLRLSPSPKPSLSRAPTPTSANITSPVH